MVVKEERKYTENNVVFVHRAKNELVFLVKKENRFACIASLVCF